MNIVLIGMMGAGKSTAGRLIAARTGRAFVDTDEEIEKRFGPIPALFARGEEHFRACERQVIAEVAGRSNAVIATGGGAAEDKRNVAALKTNGRLYYLSAPAEVLYRRCLGSDRPLARDRETFFARAKARERGYLAAADGTADASGEPGKTADAVLAMHRSFCAR